MLSAISLGTDFKRYLHGTMPQSPIESLTPEDWYLTK